MGNPDGATPQVVVDELVQAARNDPANHRYSMSKGIPKSARRDLQTLQAELQRRSRSG
jgi:alanine-synthesizing transaminase